MNGGPEAEERNPHEGQPAKRADVRAVADDVDKLAEASANAFGRFEARLGSLEHDVREIKRSMATKEQLARLLQIIESIDGRLKDHASLPERVEHLEESVLRP